MVENSRGWLGSTLYLFKQTANEWIADKAPQLGAALAYYTVFSLAPLVLLIIAVVGMIFRNDPAGAWQHMMQQMSHYLNASEMDVIRGIAKNAAEPGKGTWATIIGILLALFGASGVFAQLQASLNQIWGVKPKPGGGVLGFVRRRLLSFAMVGFICFLLLVSLVAQGVIKGLSGYLQTAFPGGSAAAFLIYGVFDLGVIVLLFAMIFKLLPDVKIRWRDVWIGAGLTAVLFLVGEWALGFYLGSGAAGSAYGAASSLITLLLWIYYSSQILLFGAEFTQVYANAFGAKLEPSAHAMWVGGMDAGGSSSPSSMG